MRAWIPIRLLKILSSSQRRPGQVCVGFEVVVVDFACAVQAVQEQDVNFHAGTHWVAGYTTINTDSTV
ncbi:hypothetical protein M8C21_020520 [Ambrosia artemisiifolia]|uniref:Uncharacterized protein n=1 Tax=Ambrosia artemisiifolia TaxID=4212 RepID=A0AAD5GLF1_AMBAR|nr:hypothetical protein M8C21_020520 [Ambrosia artemisiifolia]